VIISATLFSVWSPCIIGTSLREFATTQNYALRCIGQRRIRAGVAPRSTSFGRMGLYATLSTGGGNALYKVQDHVSSRQSRVDRGRKPCCVARVWFARVSYTMRWYTGLVDLGCESLLERVTRLYNAQRILPFEGVNTGRYSESTASTGPSNTGIHSVAMIRVPLKYGGSIRQTRVMFGVSSIRPH
jgi:hypothetical protein